ncbi:hypothetical protein ACTFIW_004022 [Dictyostelium discoideum]
MSYVPSSKLIKDLVKQDCLKKNLYETILSPEQRLTRSETQAVPVESVKRSVYEASLTAHCQKLGLKSYLQQMSQANLTTLYASVRPPLAEGEKDLKKAKVFLTKRITLAVVEDFNAYFNQLSGEDAQIFHSMTSSKIPSKIVEELTLVGLEIFLFTVQAKVLSEICAELKYDVQSNNPTLMVTSILMGAVPPKKETQPKKITFSKTKPRSLKKGLTYHDIFQHFYVDELSEYCRKHGMKVSGNKKDLINRILRFLNDGIKEVPKPKKRSTEVVDDAEVEQEEEEEEEEEEEVVEEEQPEEEEEEEDDQDAELVEEEKEEVEEEQEEAKEVVPEVLTLPTKLKKSSSSQSKIVSPSKFKKSTK